MTDRELLKRAARAVLHIHPDFDQSESWWDGFLSGWNPLDDDGDALRLLVAIDGYVVTDHHEKVVRATGLFGSGVREDYGNDRQAAVRRAIVRAAAELGRGAAMTDYTNDKPEPVAWRRMSHGDKTEIEDERCGS